MIDAAELKQTMLLAMSEHHSGNAEEAGRIVDAQLAALEAAGVRMVNFTALAEDDAAVERIGKAANVAWHKWLADSMNTSTSLDAIGSPAQACGRAAIRAMGGE